MKKGISIWAFPNQEPRDCFRMAKRFGYDGIELSFDESGPISPQSAETELMEIRKAAESHGLSLYSLASGLYWSISLTAEDPAEREPGGTARPETAGRGGCSWLRHDPDSARYGFRAWRSGSGSSV